MKPRGTYETGEKKHWTVGLLHLLLVLYILFFQTRYLFTILPWSVSFFMHLVKFDDYYIFMWQLFFDYLGNLLIPVVYSFYFHAFSFKILLLFVFFGMIEFLGFLCNRKNAKIYMIYHITFVFIFYCSYFYIKYREGIYKFWTIIADIIIGLGAISFACGKILDTDESKALTHNILHASTIIYHFLHFM